MPTKTLSPESKAAPITGMPEVRLLATRALSVLAGRIHLNHDDMAHRLREFTNAFLNDDAAVRQAAIRRLLDAGLSRDNLIDDLIPEAARLLGRLWAADEISFVDVTIGAARLQETVRATEPTRDATRAPDPDRRLLVVVPRDEHHTLGATVAADQFRRLGMETRLAVGEWPHAVAKRILNGRFKAVAISTSGRRTLAPIKELVKIIRADVPWHVPIVVGGPVLGQGLDLKDLTGADHFTVDPRSALQACGIAVPG